MDKIWVLGDAVVDLLPEGDGKLLQCPGGAPANVAVGIARLGGKSAFIGRVGDDPFGRFMQKTLADEQVDVQWMRLDPAHRTSTVVVDLDEQGERSFTFMVRPSADLFLDSTDLPPFRAKEWLHVCSIALSAEPSRSATFQAMDAIKKAGGFVSFDPNIRPDLWQDEGDLRRCLELALQRADVVKLSVEELTFLTGESHIETGLAALMRHCPARLVLVTLGKEGVMAWHEGITTHYPATPVACVDTTGAGDAFVAGLLFGL
ncbi:aminoimidazole riboside kinase, partial [Enterobacter cloacae subsp. cloacae]